MSEVPDGNDPDPKFPVLSMLHRWHEQVFEIRLSQDKTIAFLVEACDEHYAAELTRTQLHQLGDEIKQIADGMADKE